MTLLDVNWTIAALYRHQIIQLRAELHLIIGGGRRPKLSAKMKAQIFKELYLFTVPRAIATNQNLLAETIAEMLLRQRRKYLLTVTADANLQ